MVTIWNTWGSAFQCALTLCWKSILKKSVQFSFWTSWLLYLLNSGYIVQLKNNSIQPSDFSIPNVDIRWSNQLFVFPVLWFILISYSSWYNKSKHFSCFHGFLYYVWMCCCSLRANVPTSVGVLNTWISIFILQSFKCFPHTSFSIPFIGSQAV